MTRALLLAILLLAGYVIGSPHDANSAEESTGYYVTGVDPKHPHDGDGFHVAVRLYGVDTPERGSRAKCPEEAELADRAWEMTRALLRKPVTLTVHGVDRSGRLLATVTLRDGRVLGDVLKSEGLARDWPLERAWCETH